MYELYAQKITEYKCKWLTQKMQTTAWRMLQGVWFITTGSQVGKGKSELNNTKYWLPAWHKPVSKVWKYHHGLKFSTLSRCRLLFLKELIKIKCSLYKMFRYTFLKIINTYMQFKKYINITLKIKNMCKHHIVYCKITRICPHHYFWLPVDISN